MKILKKYLTKKNIFQKRTLDDQTIFYVFKKVIKDEFGNVGAEKFIPDYYKNKTLFIKSDSSTWASELWTNKVRIVRKLNAELGEGSIDGIKVK
jgi:hypothetical protein